MSDSRRSKIGIKQMPQFTEETNHTILSFYNGNQTTNPTVPCTKIRIQGQVRYNAGVKITYKTQNGLEGITGAYGQYNTSQITVIDKTITAEEGDYFTYLECQQNGGSSVIWYLYVSTNEIIDS